VKPLPLLLLAVVILSPFAARAQDMKVYDDALENGWVSYGWATLNFSNTSPVHTGTASISVKDNGTYGALYLHHAAFAPVDYQSLGFWINPTVSGSNELQVQATLTGSAQSKVYLSFTAAQVGHWVQETIPLSSLGVAGNGAFDGFWIQNITGSTNTFYVDDVSLAAIPVPSLTAVTVNATAAVRVIDPRRNMGQSP
jgi:hypothetical protein